MKHNERKVSHEESNGYTDKSKIVKITKLGVVDEEEPETFGFRAPTPEAAVPRVWFVRVTCN